MGKGHRNHYDWLESNLEAFCKLVGVEYNDRLVSAHADKCYGYKERWKHFGIPFAHGVAIYLFTYLLPYAKEVRQVGDKWIDPSIWVVNNYKKFKPILKIVEEKSNWPTKKRVGFFLQYDKYLDLQEISRKTNKPMASLYREGITILLDRYRKLYER